MDERSTSYFYKKSLFLLKLNDPKPDLNGCFSRQQYGLAFGVTRKCLGLREAAFRSAKLCNLDLFGIPLVRRLGNVRVACVAALRLDGGDVDKVAGRKHGGVLGDLVIIQRKPFAAVPPGIEREQRDGAVVGVVIDGPLREDHVGALGGQDAGECGVVLRIDNGAAVVLACEYGPGFQNLAGAAGFRSTDFGAASEAGVSAISFAAVQVEENHLMPERGIAGDSACAATLRVAWMSARDDHFQRARLGLGQKRQNSGRSQQSAT
jgi:hypothetical protein